MRKRVLIVLAVALPCLAAAAFVVIPRSSRVAAPAATRIGTIADPHLTECSGIIASRRHPGVFWTHNDRGNAPSLYAITETGQTTAEFRIAAKNEDWEDIAVDEQGRLYIGQIGNNDASRRTAAVFCFDEPDPAQASRKGRSRLKVQRSWQLAYPDHPFDSESLIIFRSYGYLISKLNGKQPAALYRFPLESQDHPIVLEKVAELPIRSPVTAADLSSDGARLAVVSGTGLDVFYISGNLSAVASAPRRHFPLYPPHHIEGCCFTPRGILAAAETREIYLFPDIVQAP